MPNVALNDPDAICTSGMLGNVLGVTARSIDALVLEGVFRPVRSSKLRGRHYRLRDSVQRFVVYQKQSVRAQFASINGEGYNKARERRMSAIALIEEARAKQISGEFVRRDRVLYVMTNLLSMVKNHMLGLPARCARRVTHQRDLAKVRAILDEDVRNSLREAAQFGEHSFNDETGKRGEKNGDSRNC